ncbi:helix-turn-helix domain-containing protein [Falsibacillus albus]|uniref:XRE family transcriptional regulator n=1 Tax=Falsibacillus albus TaxID=2478915 RepID=A0A3L7JVD0_9BACI|nr:XRE family transcriptional regulator [Falsibacillus albus]RLQ94828.1 XRE family transcriptional regulator [Falsibacillus albus]
MDEIYGMIKDLRLKNGLTLKQLSEKTELSVSFLSQVERGTSSLAITSLKKIADALGVKITEFFESESNPNYMVKASEHKPFKIERSEFTYTRLSGDFMSRSIEPLLVTLSPNQKQTQDYSHPGEEFYYVLKGGAVFNIDGTDYFMRQGDSIHFPSSCQHNIENPFAEETVLLCVLTPVIF